MNVRNLGLPNSAPDSAPLPERVGQIASALARETNWWGGSLADFMIARGKCEDASIRLAQRLRAAGEAAQVLMMTWPERQGRAMGHMVVVWAGEQIIDLTANQFTAPPYHFPVPYCPIGTPEHWMDWIDRKFVRYRYEDAQAPFLSVVKLWGQGVLSLGR